METEHSTTQKLESPIKEAPFNKFMVGGHGQSVKIYNTPNMNLLSNEEAIAFAAWLVAAAGAQNPSALKDFHEDYDAILAGR